MSDINDLIHRSSQLSYNAGVEAERRRVRKILEGLPAEFSHNGYTIRTVRTALKRIEESNPSVTSANVTERIHPSTSLGLPNES